MRRSGRGEKRKGEQEVEVEVEEWEKKKEKKLNFSFTPEVLSEDAVLRKAITGPSPPSFHIHVTQTTRHAFRFQAFRQGAGRF